MPQADLVAANPPARWSTLVSLPANLTTAMVLVDYALHQHATPTPWSYQFARGLTEEEVTRFRRLQALLAHGTNLRDFLLMRLDPAHAAHSEWEALRRWLEELPPSDMTELAIRGVLSGLEFYRTQMQPDATVESLLNQLGTREPDASLLMAPEHRTVGLQALLASWGEKDPWPAIRLAEDPVALKEALLESLTSIWRSGFEATWEAGKKRLEQAASSVSRSDSPQTTEAAVVQVTGLQPPAATLSDLRGAKQIWFFPCLHLGQHLSVSRGDYGWRPSRPGDDIFHIFYEPPSGAVSAEPVPTAEAMDLAALGPTLEALGDGTRLAILKLLHGQSEMFALQIAESLKVHPSTVSRQLALLEQMKLVRFRREGNVKYYDLDRERVRSVCRLLEQYLA